MTAPHRSHGRTAGQWFKLCWSKVRFPDEPTIRARASQLIEQGRTDRARLWVYRCPNCRGWHMTKSAYLNRGSASVTATDPYAPANDRS